VHEATAPEPSTTLLRDALQNLGSLVLASLFYGIGVFVGLLLLIVPGLLVAARWSLMAPGIMLEGRTTGEARARSREIVRGRTENGLGDRTMLALGVVVTSFLLTSVFVGVLAFLAADLFGTVLAWLVGLVVSAVAAPYQAHVLSVLYYRLVEPDRPTIHPDVQTART